MLTIAGVVGRGGASFVVSRCGRETETGPDASPLLGGVDGSTGAGVAGFGGTVGAGVLVGADATTPSMRSSLPGAFAGALRGASGFGGDGGVAVSRGSGRASEGRSVSCAGGTYAWVEGADGGGTLGTGVADAAGADGEGAGAALGKRSGSAPWETWGGSPRVPCRASPGCDAERGGSARAVVSATGGELGDVCRIRSSTNGSAKTAASSSANSRRRPRDMRTA
jgi:hypothetical protein